MFEMKKKLRADGEYEVLVCGSGPAGICAAMAAARQGARVALIERFGAAGGNLTAGHVGPIMGGVSGGTMADEINELLGVKGAGLVQDMEEAKIKLAGWLDHPNITIWLGTPVVDVIMEGKRLAGVVIGTQNGMEALTGRLVVDATGDGVVSHLAGAEIEVGRPGDGLVQPTTIMFTLCNIDPKQTIACRHEEDETPLEKGGYLELSREACRNGTLPESVNIVRLYPTKHRDERMVNATQQNKVNGLDGRELALAQRRLRAQIPRIVDFLKATVPGFEGCRLKDSSDAVGVRESRRVIGEYILQDADLLLGRTFDDVMVHRANFSIDIHNPDGAGQAESEGCPERAKPYDIPYRCFVPKTVDGLFTAGRCISGTHRAHASYRVMNICMAMGEAVGIAAALCVRRGVDPRELDYRLVQRKLVEKGALLKD